MSDKTIKPRVLINDREITVDEAKVIVTFLQKQPHMVENCLAIVAAGILTKDEGLVYDALYGLALAAILTWEMADEVDLTDQLFGFLGGNNGN